MEENKRDGQRYELSLPILYANLSQPGTVTYSYKKTCTIDVSSTGIGMTVEDQLKENDLIQVMFLLPVSPFVITGLARAVWSQEGEKDQYRAGLQFVQQTSDLKETLLAHATEVSPVSGAAESLS